MEVNTNIPTEDKPSLAKVEFRGTGRRKTSVARVRLKPGAGKIIINQRSIDDYFKRSLYVNQIRKPLEITANVNKLDIQVNVNGGGLTGQAGAILHGIARALTELDSDFRSALAKEGFLTRDSRMVERKKYGRAGARRRFQFSKR